MSKNFSIVRFVNSLFLEGKKKSRDRRLLVRPPYCVTLFWFLSVGSAKGREKIGGAEGEKQKSCQKNLESVKQRAAEAVVVFLPSSLSLAELGLGSSARPSAVPRRRLGPGSGGWHGEKNFWEQAFQCLWSRGKRQTTQLKVVFCASPLSWCRSDCKRTPSVALKAQNAMEKL